MNQITIDNETTGPLLCIYGFLLLYAKEVIDAMDPKLVLLLRVFTG